MNFFLCDLFCDPYGPTRSILSVTGIRRSFTHDDILRFYQFIIRWIHRSPTTWHRVVKLQYPSIKYVSYVMTSATATFQLLLLIEFTFSDILHQESLQFVFQKLPMNFTSYCAHTIICTI